MISWQDKIKAIMYLMMRSTAYTTFNGCSQCKKYRRNHWEIHSYKPDYLIAYDHMLHEWVLFKDYNLYAKVWLMNGYVTDIHTLDEKIWNAIHYSCERCIAKFFKT